MALSCIRCVQNQTTLALRQLRWGAPAAAANTGAVARAYATGTDEAGKQPSPYIALVQGASRGIGLEVVTQLLARNADTRVIATCRNPAQADALQALSQKHGDRLMVHELDLHSMDSIQQCAQAVKSSTPHLNLLFNVSGVLHIPGEMMPETSISRLDYSNTLLTFQTNVIGPAAVCQQFAELLQQARSHGADSDRPAVVANMSARVGSISDNQLGGWYSYRASKAALNQFTKTLSLEFQRRRWLIACVVLHPGTVDTDLSQPFQKNVPEGKLFTREQAAQQLLNVIGDVGMNKTGKFFAWDGQEIPW